VGIRNVVWNDLLDMYACPWPEGESGVTDVRQRLLENLHFSGRWVYDPSSPAFAEPLGLQDGIFYYDFRLKDLLNSPEYAWNWLIGTMDCTDYGIFLEILFNSHGLIANARKVSAAYNGPEVYRGFITNPVCKAGKHPLYDVNYLGESFKFHMITVVGSDSVFDASISLKYSLSGAIFRNPVNGWALEPWFQTWRSQQAVYGLTNAVVVGGTVDSQGNLYGATILAPHQISAVDSRHVIVWSLR
jgi:hypothetical protein